jgi:sugar phosphate permease
MLSNAMYRRWAIFLITSSNFFISQFYRASNAVIAPQLIEDLHVDTEGLGLISATFFYAFAITQIPISIFLDRVGPRRMMTGLSIVGITGAFTFSWADSLTTGVIGRMLLGVGMACNLMGTLKLLTVWFNPLSFATLSGVVFSIGTLGNMAAATPFVLLAQGMGWRMAFCLIAGINLLSTFALYIIVRDGPGERSRAPSALEASPGLTQALQDLGLLLRNRSYWIISFGTFVSYGVFASFQVLWAGPYLIEVQGLSAVEAGNLILLMNIGMILGGPAWGGISDRLFKTRKMIVSFGLVVLFLIVLILAIIPPGTGMIVLASIFFGFGLVRATSLLMYPQIKELMPLKMAGTAMTGVNFFTMIGPAVFLQGMGSLMQSLYPEASRGPEAFNTSLLLCAACLFGASILYMLTRENKGH